MVRNRPLDNPPAVFRSERARLANDCSANFPIGMPMFEMGCWWCRAVTAVTAVSADRRVGVQWSRPGGVNGMGNRMITSLLKEKSVSIHDD